MECCYRCCSFILALSFHLQRHPPEVVDLNMYAAPLKSPLAPPPKAVDLNNKVETVHLENDPLILKYTGEC